MEVDKFEQLLQERSGRKVPMRGCERAVRNPFWRQIERFPPHHASSKPASRIRRLGKLVPHCCVLAAVVVVLVLAAAPEARVAPSLAGRC
jgi:hypothetical protein